jgi:hypothetical protein
MIKSKKIVVELKNKKEESFVKSLIKDYKLKDDCFIFESNTFTLKNKHQYTFTDIRNEIYQKGIKYEEFEETITI